MSKVIEHGAGALDVERIRKDFPLLERVDHGKQIVYLDSRGVYALAEEATALYEAARARLAGFVGAPDPSCIVFTRGTTESVNLVAYGYARKVLRPGDQILLSVVEHHSNLVPWQFAAAATGAKLRFIPLADDGSLDLSGLDSLLTERTKMLCVTGMSNVLGTVPPLRQLADAAHAVGAVILVDGAQLVPHSPVDVSALDVDFLRTARRSRIRPGSSRRGP